MTRLRAAAARRPLFAAAVTVSIIYAMILSPVLIFGAQDVTNGTGVLEIVVDPFVLAVQALSATVVLGAVWILGWGRRTTLVGLSDRDGMAYFYAIAALIGVLYAAVCTMAVLTPAYPDAIYRLVLNLAFSLLIGVSEEVLFRGILMHGLRSRFTAGRALVICSAVFAAFHASNSLWGQSLVLTAQQIGFTFVFGALLGAIALQTASLWPAIVLHGLWDAYALSALLIDDPLATAGAPADPLMPAYTLGILIGMLTFIASIGLAALWIYRRWRRRVPPLRIFGG